jgi:high-affinity Fe2+/Pb2+ permease
MLTKDILFGMNILTLVGLIMTGFGLTLRRMGRAGLPLCFGVMGVGTALVLAGLFMGGWNAR